MQVIASVSPAPAGDAELLSLNAQDEEYVHSFEAVLKSLRKRSVLRRRNLLRWSHEMVRGKPPRFRHNLKDPDRIIAMLADVRKLHLQKESLQLPKVFSWLRPRLGDRALESELEALRKHYDTLMKAGHQPIVDQGRTLPPRELLDIYLNGEYFHNDADKRAQIQRLEMGLSLSRIEAIGAAANVAFTALRLGDLINRARHREEHPAG